MSATRVVLTLALAAVLVAGLVAPAWAQLGVDGSETPVNTFTAGNQSFPAVGMAADGRFVVAWMSEHQDGSDSGVYAQRYAAGGIPQGVEFRVNTFTTSSQEKPAVGVAADGRFVIAWHSYGQDGGASGVYAQRYAADGSPQGGEFRVNTYTPYWQDEPTVGMAADGRFVVAWASWNQDGSEVGVYAQRYAADGTPQGGELRVNTYTPGEQYRPAVAMAADGRFVVTWASENQDGDSYGIYAQRFAADGTPQGPEFRVNTTTAEYQNDPAIGMAADGRFVIAWVSLGNISAQRYAADGTPQGGELQVNTFATYAQNDPAVGMAADGRSIIAWASQNQDGGGFGVYGQRYDAAGASQGGEYRVNTTTTGDQGYPAAALSANGRLVVAWTSDTAGTDDIVAQRFTWNEPPNAQNDSYTLGGPALSVPAPGVLANDTDSDSPSLTAQLVSGPSAGAVTLNPDGSFVYSPRADFAGTDQFAYVASDGHLASQPATVTISWPTLACEPRPRVRLTTTVVAGRLDVLVEASQPGGPPPNSLTKLRFGPFQNARVTLDGQPVTPGQIVALPPNITRVGFSVTRATPGQATTVPFVVVDGCGEWPTFVGGGTGAGF